MATFTATAAKRLKEGRLDGHVADLQAQDLIVYHTVYTTVGSEVATDIIELTGMLPKGIKIVPALSIIRVAASTGTALTADLGFQGDNDAVLGTNVVLTAAGKVELTTAEKEIDTTDDQIIATVKTATAIVAGIDIEFYFVARQTS